MNFDSKMPIYRQIMDEIKRWIVKQMYMSLLRKFLLSVNWLWNLVSIRYVECAE